jgi:hypothetical protein
LSAKGCETTLTSSDSSNLDIRLEDAVGQQMRAIDLGSGIEAGR